MTKTAMIVAILAVLVGSISTSTAQTPNRVSALDDAFEQIQKSDEELRAANNIHDKQIKELQVKVAVNQTTTPAPANDKIDYTRYTLLTKECAGEWTVKPELKDTYALAWNGYSQEQFDGQMMRCYNKKYGKVTRPQPVAPALQIAPPPSPGVMQDPGQRVAQMEDRQCDIPNTVYVPQLNGCMLLRNRR